MVTRASNAAVPRPGDVFALAEQDYRYGVGPILAQVVAIVDQVRYDNEPWWHVDVNAANGTPDHHGGWLPRTLYLRESSIPSTRMPWPTGP